MYIEGQKKSILIRPGEYYDENGRDYYFDNARFILITLVVIGHFIEPLIPTLIGAKFLWRFINTLHIPAMIFISGFFSKSYIKGNKINIQRPFSYAILYIIFQLIFILYSVIVLNQKIACTLLTPKTGLWYLQCLTLWYMLLPLINKIKPKYAMIGAIICGILIGYDQNVGTFLSVSRAISHMPFFLAGYYMEKDTIKNLFNKKAKIISVFLIMVVSAAFLMTLNLKIGKLPGSKTNYWDLPFLKDVTPLLWWCSRLLSYTASMLLIFSFFSFVPRCWTIFTSLGSRTLQVYILHLFIYLAANEFGWYEPFSHSVWGLAAITGIAILTAIILSLKPFSYPFKLLQSIKVNIFLKESD